MKVKECDNRLHANGNKNEMVIAKFTLDKTDTK